MKYVKVTVEVAKELGFFNIRQRVADGDFILNANDLSGVMGDNIEEKIKEVEGKVLTLSEAKELLKELYQEPEDETTPDSDNEDIQEAEQSTDESDDTIQGEEETSNIGEQEDE